MFGKQKFKQVLEGIPKELQDILVPSSTNVAQLELAYVLLRRREGVRNKLMKLQRDHGLSFEPNASEARVKMKLRLKKKIMELHQPPDLEEGKS